MLLYIAFFWFLFGKENGKGNLVKFLLVTVIYVYWNGLIWMDMVGCND